nr:MAG TPA: hypothetical protein [Caudoviricetes sp.]
MLLEILFKNHLFNPFNILILNNIYKIYCI